MPSGSAHRTKQRCVSEMATSSQRVVFALATFNEFIQASPLERGLTPPPPLFVYVSVYVMVALFEVGRSVERTSSHAAGQRRCLFTFCSAPAVKCDTAEQPGPGLPLLYARSVDVHIHSADLEREAYF